MHGLRVRDVEQRCRSPLCVFQHLRRACPAGSTSATAAACPAGEFSDGGAGVCSPCAPGRFGNTTGLSTCAACPAGRFGFLQGAAMESCSGPCRPGAFGSLPGQTSAACVGNCTAGYACPAGSTSPTAVLCPVGRYSTAGSASCVLCPVGTYGDSVGLTTPACSGPCAVGYICPPGSNTSTPFLSCPVGRYGEAASGSCVDCPVGRFGPLLDATSPDVCTTCAAGFYGNTSGLSTAQCSGVCPQAPYFPLKSR